jgi:hypothetical protein
MRQKLAASVIALAGPLVVLAACATPGIDYEARLMPASADAAATRTVQVDGFRGPGGRWYTDRFEAMLANTVFDGAPWFQIASLGYAGPDSRPVGTYTGSVSIESYTLDERYRTVKKCVEWDGLFDCETRAEVEEFCTDERVTVSVTPRLIDAMTGELVFSNTYFGDSSYEQCHETGRINGHGDKHSRRGHGGGRHHGFGALTPPRDLILDALSETLRPIRNDIAPRNATVRATFVTEAIDPIVRADPRFEQAVKLGRKDPFTSCDLWSAMATEYPEAPAVTHNMGACAEASNDFQAAQGLYAKAAELTSAFDSGHDGVKRIMKSLREISAQRFDLEALDDIVNPEARLPVAEVES